MDGQQELGMKWYKFLVFFGLWAGAILNFINGITLLTGAIYEAEGVSSELVYSTFPNLKGIDEFFGLIAIAIAIYQGYTAFSLLKFKQVAPKLLTILYCLTIAYNLLYAIFASSIIGESLLGDTIAPIITSAVMLVINYKYFKNREHLFIY